jgi:hypothetical protein
METDSVKAIAQLFSYTSDEMEQAILQIKGKVTLLEWEGASRATFDTSLGELDQRFSIHIENIRILTQRLIREVDEWEQIDSAFVPGSSIVSDISLKLSKQSFKNDWSKMNLEDRKAWLEKWYKSLCDKFGIPYADFRVEDLQDPANGDLKGVHKSGFWIFSKESITIDTDNVFGDDPSPILETVAHETRHSMQEYYIDHPDQRPENISDDQLKVWEENKNNYHRPEDDFEAYYKQPVEQDARDFGDKTVDEYFLSRKAI